MATQGGTVKKPCEECNGEKWISVPTNCDLCKNTGVDYGAGPWVLRYPNFASMKYVGSNERCRRCRGESETRVSCPTCKGSGESTK